MLRPIKLPLRPDVAFQNLFFEITTVLPACCRRKKEDCVANAFCILCSEDDQFCVHRPAGIHSSKSSIFTSDITFAKAAVAAAAAAVNWLFSSAVDPQISRHSGSAVGRHFEIDRGADCDPSVSRRSMSFQKCALSVVDKRVVRTAARICSRERTTMFLLKKACERRGCVYTALTFSDSRAALGRSRNAGITGRAAADGSHR